MIRACLWFSSALLAASVAFSPVSAHAKQCVWNKGWFLLKVQWYPTDALVFVEGEAPTVMGGRLPVQIDVIPGAQGSCLEGEDPHYAVLSVIGGKFASDLTKLTVGAVVAAAGTAATVLSCGATGGAGCLATGAGVTAAVAGTTTAIPDGKEVFAITVPRQDRWTDVWGTVWEPVYSIDAGGAF